MDMLIDLSRPIEPGMPVYPGDVPVELEKIRCPERDHYTAYLWRTGLHGGTHVDAPMHLLADGCSMDQMPLNHFIAQGVLLKNGETSPQLDIPEGAAVLIDLGMEDAYGTDAYYDSHPVISDALCEYLIERKVSLVGVNAPSPDHPPFPVHKKLLGAGIPILENLMNLSQLEGKQFMLLAMPLAIRAEASPVRAVAWVRDSV